MFGFFSKVYRKIPIFPTVGQKQHDTSQADLRIVTMSWHDCDARNEANRRKLWPIPKSLLGQREHISHAQNKGKL
jgi:hypothetical protein